ncbi:hypothetical protein [Homoserinimonas sp. A520]
MRNITRITLAFVGAAALTATVAFPASAATDTTNTTVEVQGGVLSVTAPASLALTGVQPGATATGTLTGVAVTDETADTVGWTASISITAFASTADPTLTIAATNVSYAPTVAVVTGTATATKSDATGGSGNVQVASAVTGNNTATWDGAVSLAVPSDALAANDYTATLTHSVL